MSYDPSKWYSYSKNRPNVEDEIPCKKFDYIKNLERETNSKDEILSEEGSSKIEESKIDPGPSPLSAENVGHERNLETMKIPGVNVEQLETRKLNDFVKRLQKMTREAPPHLPVGATGRWGGGGGGGLHCFGDLLLHGGLPSYQLFKKILLLFQNNNMSIVSKQLWLTRLHSMYLSMKIIYVEKGFSWCN